MYGGVYGGVCRCVWMCVWVGRVCVRVCDFNFICLNNIHLDSLLHTNLDDTGYHCIFLYLVDKTRHRYNYIAICNLLHSVQMDNLKRRMEK